MARWCAAARAEKMREEEPPPSPTRADGLSSRARQRLSLFVALGSAVVTARLVRALLMAVALLTGCAIANVFASRGRQEPNSLKVRLVVSPALGLAPLRVRVNAVVQDPRRELHCPAYAWSWGDGSTSSEWADCDPYQLEEEHPASYAPNQREHTYWAGGDYRLVFAVASLGVKRSEARLVSVYGGGR